MASVFDQVSQGVQQAATGVVTGAKSLAEQLPGKVTGAASELLSGAKSLVSGTSIGDLAGGLSGNKLVGPAVNTLLGGATVGGAAKTLGDIASNLPDTVSGMVSGAGSMLADLPGTIVDGAKGLYNDVAGFVSGTSVDTLVGGVGSEIIGAVSSQGGLLGKVAGALGGVIDNKAVNTSWGKLNPKLITNLFPCDSDGNVDVSELPVNAPITEASIEFSYNWQSAFENSGPESKAPALMAMLQTGQFGSVINALQAVLPDSIREATGGLADEVANKAREASTALEGRTGITKLNSRQVFSGMPPIKINLTMHLRAINDPEREIYALYQRLLRWSLPQQLAADSTLTGIIKQAGNTAEMVKALFPSQAPMMVGLVYGGQVFKPMVIETLSNPLDGPRYRDGKYVYLPVQMTLSTLTALDRSDVARMFLSF